VCESTRMVIALTDLVLQSILGTVRQYVTDEVHPNTAALQLAYIASDAGFREFQKIT
jgi:hypothetical protein